MSASMAMRPGSMGWWRRSDRAGYDVPTASLSIGIRGMTCASLRSGGSRRRLARLPGVLSASVNLATERAEVVAPAGAVGLEDLARAVERAGYDPVIEVGQSAADEEERRAREARDQRRGSSWCSPPRRS